MEQRIGLYTQLTEFSTENAGTAEWCKAERGGRKYFVKKFQTPVYPSKDIGLPEKMYLAGVKEFKEAMEARKDIYRRLRECDQTGVLVVPEEVINYQFHICTVAEYITGNVAPDQIHLLSEWQRIILMRTLTLALMNVHRAGIVHSDMKPDNVLITQDKNGHCRLHLIDFDGSFPESDPPSDSEEVVGDPTFFAPEAYQQAVYEEIRLDHRIDIFALGIIFHYFWCGRYPDKPANQTIGEYLLRGGTVTADPSVPPALRQLIQRMITVKPEDRLPLKSVYDVLGVQAEQFPAAIINLQPKHARPSEPEKETGKGSRKAAVEIRCVNGEGDVLRRRSIWIPYGSSETVEADEIEGYRLTAACAKEKTVTVDDDGSVATPVTFSYRKRVPDRAVETEKKGKGKKILLVLAVLFLAYWLITYLLTTDAYQSDQFDSALQYMKLTPFYTTFHRDQAETAESIVNPAQLKMLNPRGSVSGMAYIHYGGATEYFSFTPSETGYYIFSSEKTGTRGIVRNASFRVMQTDDSGVGEQQFRIRIGLNAGSTYYFGVEYRYSGRTGDIWVKLQWDKYQ